MPKSPYYILPLFLILLSITNSVYIPELQLCASTDFLNKQIINFGPTIQEQLDNAKIPDISYDDKFDGVHVQFNLTNIKQKFKINWNTNVINVQNQNSFILNSKNINMTLTAHIQFKVGLTVKQKGQLDVQIQKLEADTTLAFTQPHCSAGQGRGIGFDLQIQNLFVNTQKLTIKIQGKGIDNLVIRAVMSVLKSRLPSIIQKTAKQAGNPAISKLTCSPVQQVFPLGQQKYVAIINTTNVPHFINKQIYASLDVTFVNQATNATNNQIQNDNLPQQDLFGSKAQLSLLASSNMMNSILWLIDDSKALNINLTNDKLPPNAPIQLNTLNLSILIPGLLKYGRKQVILVIQPSNRFSHLYIRNGKMVAVLSLSIKFVVNNTGGEQTVDQCLRKNRCILACDLNATIPFSAAIKITHNDILSGLVHTIAIQQLQTISAQIPVKTDQLKKILNTMIGSFRPQINQQIQQGIKIDLSQLQKYQVEGVQMITKKDYAGIGVMFKK